MISAGIRQVKDNLSRYIRRIEAGERIQITAHGRVVAALVPPREISRTGSSGRPDRLNDLVAEGMVRAPVEQGDPLEDWPVFRLAPGTAAELIDSDRGDT
jgi:antitoxin (DNA-binding transcriptional repressor) of toxin-antitoxin stability system